MIGWLMNDFAEMFAQVLIEEHGEGITPEGREKLRRQLVSKTRALLEAYEEKACWMQRRLFGDQKN